ncbi:hypothetical protein CGEO_1235 [Campylobacter geochelonis]|nr:hypothetical protein CGEO_1235 [Campylobacter geochelonis]
MISKKPATIIFVKTSSFGSTVIQPHIHAVTNIICFKYLFSISSIIAQKGDLCKTKF